MSIVRRLIPYILLVAIAIVYHVYDTNQQEQRAINELEKLFNEQQTVQMQLVKESLQDDFEMKLDELEFLAQLIRAIDAENSNVLTLIDNEDFLTSLDTDSVLWFLDVNDFELPENTIPVGGENMEVASALLDNTLSQLRGNQSRRSLYVASDIIATPDYQYYALAQNIIVDNKSVGVIGVVIDFGSVLEKYVGPVRSGQYGAAWVQSHDGTVIYDHEKEIIGQNVFDLHENYPELIELDLRYQEEESGEADYSFTVQRGGEVTRKLVAWNTVTIGSQSLTVALSAPASDVSNTIEVNNDLTNDILLFIGLGIFSLGIFWFQQREMASIIEKRTKSLLEYQETLESEISTREKAERSMRYSENRYRQLVDSSPIGIIIHDGNQIIFSNPTGAKLLGYEKRMQIIGENVGQFVHPEYRSQIAERIQTIMQDHVNLEPMQEKFVAKDKRVLDVMVTGLYFDNNGKPAVQVLFEDITEQLKAEEALANSENRYRQISKLLSDFAFSIFVEKDNTFTVEWLDTEAFEALLGYQVTLPAVAEDVIKLFAPPDYIDEVLNTLRKTVSENTTQVVEFPAQKEDGGHVWLRLTRMPIWNEREQRVTQIFGAGTDISALKQSQQILVDNETLKVALEKEKELATVRNRFLSTLAHEVRTPLTVINTSSVLLDQYFDKLSEEKRAAEFAKIKSSVTYLTKILQELNLAAKTDKGYIEFHPSPVEVRPYFRKLIKKLEDTAGHKHNINFTVDDEVEDTYLLDSTAIEYIMTNLLSNAIKYSPADSDINVNLELERGFLKLTVSDQGIGIPKVDLDRIFDPFHRGENVGMARGTGLGLSIVNEMVKLHQGKIEVETALNEGTTFNITLPANKAGDL